ncbi:hypothetical protein [Paracoccus sp. SM22M-07]|uniref:hypothetical protein n=1 Tax=Paracoccus sp. SM22M-07 TaxID=1520813 RepID=UPI003529F09B
MTAPSIFFTINGLFGLPLRQMTEMGASLPEMAGLDWPVPDLLNLLVDGAGIKVLG